MNREIKIKETKYRLNEQCFHCLVLPFPASKNRALLSSVILVNLVLIKNFIRETPAKNIRNSAIFFKGGTTKVLSA